MMRLEMRADVQEVAAAAAAFIAAAAREAIERRGRFVLALSGGGTPSRMLQLLAGADVPWGNVHIAQVDERAAPSGHPDRNLTQLTADLLERIPLRAAQVHPMPVESSDLEAAAAGYAATLTTFAGAPPVVDLVHLGLGTDGHTASLVPGDPVLGVTDADVAVTGPYSGRRRVTLTYPVLNRARRIVWLVTGADKAPMLARLLAGDASIPAGRVRREDALVFADRAAASGLDTAS